MFITHSSVFLGVRERQDMQPLSSTPSEDMASFKIRERSDLLGEAVWMYIVTFELHAGVLTIPQEFVEFG